MNLFAHGEGNTPLSAEEQADLIPNLATKEELNEWERQNILEAYAWALAANNLRRNDPLVEPYVRDLHRRMFDQTWRWAGVYRTSEKNIGVPHHEIRERLAGLLGDARYWISDVLGQRQGRPVFTWGGADLVRAGDFRRHYIEALQAADGHDLQPLLAFARS